MPEDLVETVVDEVLESIKSGKSYYNSFIHVVWKKDSYIRVTRGGDVYLGIDELRNSVRRNVDYYTIV